MRKFVCPSCGASLSFSEDREFGFCEYCGEKIILDDYRTTHRIVDEAKIKEAEANKEIRLRELDIEEAKLNQRHKGISVIIKILVAVLALALVLAIFAVVLNIKKSNNNVIASGSATFGNIISNEAKTSSEPAALFESSDSYSNTNDEANVTDMRTSQDTNLEITEYDYCTRNGYLFYYVKLHNPSTTEIIEYPQIRITAKDATGALLGSEEMCFHSLYPGQESNYATQAFAVDENPASVIIEPLPLEEYQISSVSNAEHQIYVPLEVTGVSVRNTSIVGEIVNKNDYSITLAWVTIVFCDSDGKMLDSEFTFISQLTANGSTPFSIDKWKIPDYASIKSYAENWE